MPNDHHVPRVHLKRFAVPGARSRDEWFIDAAKVDSPDRTWRTNIKNVGAVGNFYTFLDFDDQESRDLEEFFSRLEDAVATRLAGSAR